MATSRVPLGVLEEHVYSLGPLANTDRKSEAVAFFVRSAQHAKHGFELTSANRRDVQRIVEVLGGVPLGLQIAAGLLSDISPRELLAEFPNLLDIENPRPESERHQSLRHVIRTSLLLVPESARELLFRLTVFHGPFTREDVREVCPLPTGSTHLALLSRLTTHSLLQREEESGATIYRLLDSVREHLLGNEASGAQRVDQEKHAHVFLERATEIAVTFQQGRWKLGSELLNLRLPNLRWAVRYAIDTNVRESILAFSRALARVYFVTGHWSEFRELADLGLALARQNGEAEIELTMLGLRGAHAHWNNELGQAVRIWSSRADRATELGLDLVAADAALDLALAYRDQGNSTRSRESVNHAKALLLKSGNDTHILMAKALAFEAQLHRLRGHRQKALAAAKEALAIERLSAKNHDEFAVGLSVASIGIELGRVDLAREVLLEMVERAMEGNRPYELALACRPLATLAEGDDRLMLAGVAAAIHDELGSREARSARQYFREMAPDRSLASYTNWRLLVRDWLDRKI